MAIETDDAKVDSSIIEIASCDLDIETLTCANVIRTYVAPQNDLELAYTKITEKDLEGAPSLEEALKRFEGAEYYAAHHFLHLRYYLSGFGKNWINTEFCGFKLVSRPRISKWPDLAEKFGLAAEVWEHKSSETEKLAIFSAHYLGVIFETDKCSIQKLVNMSITDDVFPEYRPEDVIHDEF